MVQSKRKSNIQVETASLPNVEKIKVHLSDKAVASPKKKSMHSKRSRKQKSKKSKVKASPTRVPVYEDYDDYEECEDGMEALIETLSSKLHFHVFNPEDYVIESHKQIMIVPPDHRKTSEIMTEYEYTEVTSHRAKQIENGSPVYADVGEETNPIRMSEIEIRAKKCPLAVRRLHNALVGEIWHVNEMSIP
jgi:DNA-directed RNA polymerase subunit K/omega